MSSFLIFISHNVPLVTAFLVVGALLLLLEWRHRVTGAEQMSPAGLIQLMNHADATVVDIRPPAARHHTIINAVLIEAGLPEVLKKLEQSKQKCIVLVDEAGQVALNMAAQLKKQGFEKVVILRGGMRAWQQANMPVIKLKEKITDNEKI